MVVLIKIAYLTIKSRMTFLSGWSNFYAHWLPGQYVLPTAGPGRVLVSDAKGNIRWKKAR